MPDPVRHDGQIWAGISEMDMTDTATLEAARPEQGARNPHGSFIWYELLTNNPDAAKRFYDEVVGWAIEAEPSGPMDYRMIDTGTGLVGGVMRLDDTMKAGGARPTWLGYIGVDDVDASVEAVTAAGGAVRMPAWDIPNVGRVAMVADPQGAPFYLMRGATDAASTAFVATMQPGHACWNELATSDPAAAIDFYARQFGWTKGDAMPMGEMGEYRFLHLGEPMIGAVMKQPSPEIPPMWITYFYVPDIDRAAEAVKAGGGAIHFGPSEIPGGDYSITAGDSEGAVFGVVGPRKQGE